MNNIFAIVLTILNVISIKTIADAKFFSADIAREKLLSDLFVNYNPSLRPGQRTGERTDVSVSIQLQHFDFRESDGAFNIVGLFNAVWRDKKLSWNPKDYNDVKEIAINQRLVWVPDLEMYNNAPDRFLRMQRNGFVALNYEGNMTWSDAIELTIFCSTNMLHWPRDKHICHLVLGSWVYDGNALDITNHNDLNSSLSFDDDHIKNMEYEITEYSALHETTKYACCEEPYVHVKYEIQFERRDGFSTILYVPAYTLILFTLLALSMKPNRSEKILLNGLNLILTVFLLLYFAQSAAKFARGTPYIVVFYSSSLVISTFVQLISVFSLWTSRSLHKGKVLPVWISKILNGSFAHLIASNQFLRFTRESLDPQFDCSSLIPTETHINEWIYLATLLERVALIVISFVYIILTSVCLA